MALTSIVFGSATKGKYRSCNYPCGTVVLLKFTSLSTVRPLYTLNMIIVSSIRTPNLTHHFNSLFAYFRHLRPGIVRLDIPKMQKPDTPPAIGNADRSGGLLATSILALTLAVIFIALRFATRVWPVKRVGWNDWCIMFVGVCLVSCEQAGRRLLNTLIGSYHRHGPDHSAKRIRLWPTSVLPHRTSIPRIHEVL